MTQIAYKVLLNGRSCHGGSLAWSLPSESGPGDWHEVTGPLTLCWNGLHLTTMPPNWWVTGSTLYEAEYDGECVGDGGDKIAVRRVRLVRVADWGLHRVWDAGAHTVSGTDRAVAYGSATVQASGSATVRASDSATVQASDSATVRAYDSATVQASDSATVEASGNATVEASGSATVEASDDATVRASGNATVIRTRWHRGRSITLSDLAVCIDRRIPGAVTTHVAPWTSSGDA